MKEIELETTFKEFRICIRNFSKNQIRKSDQRVLSIQGGKIWVSFDGFANFPIVDGDLPTLWILQTDSETKDFCRRLVKKLEFL
jgi:hypothetical protein